MPKRQDSARALKSLRKRLKKLSADLSSLAFSISKDGKSIRPEVIRKRSAEISLYFQDYAEKEILNEVLPDE